MSALSLSCLSACLGLLHGTRERRDAAGRGKMGIRSLILPDNRISDSEVSVPQMLLNLHKKTWMDGLTLQDYDEHCALNQKTVKVC